MEKKPINLAEMKKLTRFIGIISICLGIVLLTVSYFTGWTRYAPLLCGSLLLIAAGTFLHFYVIKKSDRY